MENQDAAAPSHDRQAREHSASPHSGQESLSLAKMYADIAVSPSLSHRVVLSVSIPGPARHVLKEGLNRSDLF
jgi:hypothetical protein